MPWDAPIEDLGNQRYRLGAEHREDMRVDGVVFSDESLLDKALQDNALEQVANVATLPGIVGQSLAMPDIHWGYGFPIGGVAAFASEEVETGQGVVSPGGVGFDINCGVRLLRTNLVEADLKDKLRPLIDTLFDLVPSGLGSKGLTRLRADELDPVMEQGAGWAAEQGYLWERDLEVLEEQGCLDSAAPELASQKARARGAKQLGSLGSGNHFLEVQVVEELFDDVAAQSYGLTGPGQVVVMMHTGSRGFGHQVCQDHLDRLQAASRKYDIKLADRQLACAPLHTKEANTYLQVMAAAANYAWANRSLITHWTREAFKRTLGTDAEDLGLETVYDVAHNIAKQETHSVDGSMIDVVVHRKGATRAFGPGHPDIPAQYREVGQPVIVPGDMGSSSYLLAGTQGAMDLSFGSTCHGAGRALSRTKARKQFQGQVLINDLWKKQRIYVKAQSPKVAAEEAPQAYKDVSQVVEVCQKAGIAKQVARMRPLGVVKG